MSLLVCLFVILLSFIRKPSTPNQWGPYCHLHTHGS